MKPNADVSAVCLGPNGDSVRWDPADPDPGKRPLDIGFDTASGEGFSNATATFNRPTDKTYTDLAPLNEIKFYSAGGRELYCGRIKGAPVGDTWQADCASWMATHGKPFVDLLIERDLSQFGDIASGRRATLYAFGISLDKSYTASVDSALRWAAEKGVAIPNDSSAQIAYTAPAGAQVGKVQFSGSELNATNVEVPAVTSCDEDQISNQVTDNMTLDGTLKRLTLGVPKRSLVMEATATSTHTPTDPFSRTIDDFAVIGDHNLPLIARDEGPDGIAASVALIYLANKYAPMLDTSGVQGTSYPIPNAVWRDLTTFQDAAKDLNAYHHWKLGAWESRKLVFEPYDLTVADWQVRNGIEGVRVENVGDQSENVFNGAVVKFTDFQGVARTITPDDATDLRDSSDWIAANQWNEAAWLPIDISWPCDMNDAVSIGMLGLAFANQASRPSTITVPRHIRDIHGHWHPSSVVRANQTISVMNQHSPIPRLITGTSWRNHELTITTDNAVNSLEELQTRVNAYIGAKGLS